MKKIKHAGVLLIAVFICSCAARERAVASPVGNRSDGIISNSTENTAEFEVEAEETAETEGGIRLNMTNILIYILD